MHLLRTAIVTAGALGILSISGYAQDLTGQKPASEAKFDPELAQRLGADEYGMKAYVFAILKSGQTKIADAKVRQTLIAGHLKNIGRLADEGKLVLAGPFLTDQAMRGIFIFNVTTVEEAKKLIETDPSIKAGLFDVDLFPWYGTAALLELNQIHHRIQKKSPGN